MSGDRTTGVARIQRAFDLARARGSCALMPFITAGYPDLGTTERLLRELPDAGADLVEIGIPFSDPIADGPVIAESMHKALLGGTTPEAVLECVARARPAIPVLAMVSVSIVERMGVGDFFRRCAAAGISGVIVPDAGSEFWSEVRSRMDSDARAALDHLGIVEFVSPTTTRQRIEEIVPRCTGFIYLLARAGITGERSDAPEVADRVAAIRSVGAARIAVGFGISTREHVAAVGRHADGAIVGSAIVRKMTEAAQHGESAAEAALSLVRSLRSG
ncbi:MAG: tryptophan synthase alpha chain [Planctomycetota bacterium]|jgi:tryptophan synthase alpha chain